MRWGLAIVIVGGVAGAQETPPPAQAVRIDEVGMAGRTGGAGDGARVFVAHRTLSAGSFVELTALDSGRTILAEVRGDAPLPPGRVADLSPGAADALGLSDTVSAPVRIRPIVPSPQDQTALRDGAVVTRLEAPAALLVALRRRLPALPRPSREMTRHAVTPPAIRPRATAPVGRPPVTARPVAQREVARPAAPIAQGRWFVQVAALSDAARAATLAKSVGGVVRRAGTLYRVQTGPFATRAAADTARAALARRGFDDARTIAQD